MSDVVPCPGCHERAFACDACLHRHLVERHAVRYSDVFGHAPEGWTQLCTTHSACLRTMMGL